VWMALVVCLAAESQYPELLKVDRVSAKGFQLCVN
jgi:hypothetical protein